MELKQELMTHLTQMQSLAKTAKDFRPKFSIWKMVLWSVIVFAIGFLQGVYMGNREGWTRGRNMDAAWRVMETSGEAKGDVYITSRFRRRAMDGLVVDYVEQVNSPYWKRAPSEWLYRSFLGWRTSADKELNFARRIAEQRLTLLSKPSSETLESFRERGNKFMTMDFEQQYTSTAAAYSQVLGRAIKPAELVTDAEIRAHLLFVDAEKSRLGVR
ncbi:MAG: hypothetical protein ABL931_18335 [Usitatibacteraceae bacterium]